MTTINLAVEPSVRMDEKDVRIFCEMGFKYADYNRFASRRISPTEIGKKLGLTEKTVRLRIKKMEEDGFIKYYQAVPNLALFGFRIAAMCGFEASDSESKRKAIDHLRRAPMVVDMTEFLGALFSVTLPGASRDEILARTDDIVKNLKLRGMFGTIERPLKEPELKPNSTDWQMIQELRYDALRPTMEVSVRTGMTRRMTDYRILKLLESRAFSVKAIKNPQKMSGIIFYGLNLFVDEAKKGAIDNKLREEFGERIWLVFSPKSGVLAVNLFAFKVEEPEEALQKALRLKGVLQGSLLIAKEDIEPDRPSWLDGLIAAKTEATPVA